MFTSAALHLGHGRLIIKRKARQYTTDRGYFTRKADDIMDQLTPEILRYITEHSKEAYDLLLTLGRIPAPSNHEEQRAEFCKNWLQAQGAEGVYLDDALNVVYPVGCTGNNPVIVFMAHTDVVFGDTTPLPLVVEDGKIKAPGIGDDTANLCALLLCAKYIAENKLRPKGNIGLLFVANSGEEGLGNLKGSRQIVSAYGSRIQEFFSFDGYMDGLVDNAVGSMRYRVEVLTEGGHSFANFGNRNAIAYLASMIGTLYTVSVPQTKTKTTFNVGIIQGGTSVNSIAQQAEMLFEFRSDSRQDLAFMDAHFQAVVDSYRTKGITVNTALVGERPCSGEIDEERQAALTRRATEVLQRHTGSKPTVGPSSTDCNIPLSLGIPSVCLGTVRGALAHTREEWVQIDSLVAGYRIAFEMILHYFA